jgi:hypothetical protein
METPKGSAAPASGSFDDIVDIADLFADPEIEALLDFAPVPRLYKGKGGWTPELQREFIARLAFHGSPGRAAEDMGKDRSGLTKLYKAKEAASFRAAWDAAVELAESRKPLATPPNRGLVGHPPSVDHRRKWKAAPAPLPGQVMNEYGEWEDEQSFLQRVDAARDSIRTKLLRARRLYLQEISDSPGKRAAFEILTELPIDWEKAAHGEPQPDEPWRKANQRQPDMILTAESGWSMGEIGYGPDKKAELKKAIDEYRASEGLPAIEWEH